MNPADTLAAFAFAIIGLAAGLVSVLLGWVVFCIGRAAHTVSHASDFPPKYGNGAAKVPATDFTGIGV